jgi:DNA-binding NtrC family response regulator
LAEWLGDHGYTVVTAGNAMDALQLLEVDASIDLVVTDIVMPGGLNGFDLGRRAERLRPDIKLLYMSAYAIAETIRAAQDDALPMMRKPFKLDRLLESVEAVLQH